MAYIVTPGFGLQLADPATIQQFETSVVNADFLALENGILVERARITTAISDLETVEGWGAGRSGANGRTQHLASSVSALNTIAATAARGDIIWLDIPGTGVNRHAWEVRQSGAPFAEPAGTIYASSKANLDAFIAAIIAAGSNARFRAGAIAYITGNDMFYEFTNAAGAYTTLRTDEWNLIKIPSAQLVVGGGTVTVSDDGVITLNAVTFAGDGLKVQNALVAPYLEFKLVWDLAPSGAEMIDLTLLTTGGTAGASVSAAFAGADSAGAYSGGTAAVFQLGSSTSTRYRGEVDILDSTLSGKSTVLHSKFVTVPAPGTAPQHGTAAGQAASAQVNAGFKLKARTAAALSGTIALYGRYKGGA